VSHVEGEKPNILIHVGGTQPPCGSYARRKSPFTASHTSIESLTFVSHVGVFSLTSLSHVGDVEQTSISHVLRETHRLLQVMLGELIQLRNLDVEDIRQSSLVSFAKEITLLICALVLTWYKKDGPFLKVLLFHIILKSPSSITSLLQTKGIKESSTHAFDDMKQKQRGSQEQLLVRLT
jgi:hypothetical protein